MGEVWRGLRVGDRVRVVAWPPEIPADQMHAETREFYRWLIETGSVLTVTEIDEWVRCAGSSGERWAESSTGSGSS